MPVQRPTQTDLPDSAPARPSIVDDLFEIASARNLEEMLNQALRMTIRMLRAESGSILFQGQRRKSILFGNFRPEALERIQQWEEAVQRRLQDTEWTISSEASFPVSVSNLPGKQLLLVNAPLVQSGRVVGCISCVLPPGTDLTENKRILLVKMAQGLGQMASLISDLELAQHRLNQISIFYDVGQALVTTFDIAKLLSQAMELAANVLDAGAASIVLIDEERKELVFKVSYNSKGPVLREQRIPLDEGIAGWVASNGRPVISNNARADDRFSHRVDVRTGFLTQSIAAVPLKIKGRIIGVMEVLNKYSGDGFNQDDIQLLNSIATQAAIAIENARLYQEVCEERNRIVKSQEDIRRDLVNRLKQGPAQSLAAINQGLERLSQKRDEPELIKREVEALRELVQQATRETHNLLFESRPLSLETAGLVDACRKYVEHLRHQEAFTVHLKTVDEVNYNLTINQTLFSIIQEALNNARRHAQPENIWLLLEVKRGRFVVTIRDDGQGFDPEQTAPLGFGLVNIRQAATAIQAELTIESKMQPPNQGTKIEVALPWTSQGNHETSAKDETNAEHTRQENA